MQVQVTVTLASLDVYATALDGRTWVGRWPWQFGPAPEGWTGAMTTHIERGRAKLAVPSNLVKPAASWMADKPRTLNLNYHMTIDNTSVK